MIALRSVIALYDNMNNKQSKTLQAIFTDPVSGSVAWNDVESLLVSCGCKVLEGKGSAVKFAKDGVIASFHRPHPDKNAKRYQIRDAREYLTKIGVQP